MDRTYDHLTPEQLRSFLSHGFLCLESCFSRAEAARRTSTVWARLGMSPADKSSWTRERINMPNHHLEEVRSFAPKAWAAICELLGGEDRIAPEESRWGDGYIVNLGTPEWEGKWPDPRELDGWHVDGDFFMHFLDSKEQALLVIPLFTDIVEHAGGTMICPDAIPFIARHLYDHPEGVSPHMHPHGEPDAKKGHEFYCSIVNQCSKFVEMTGNVGDVILMHPLMVHSASRNSLRIPRIITNPTVVLKEPFNFDRERQEDYSLVELKTLQALGKERLDGWKITSSREGVVPDAWRVKDEMKMLELERLAKEEQMKV